MHEFAQRLKIESKEFSSKEQNFIIMPREGIFQKIKIIVQKKEIYSDYSSNKLSFDSQYHKSYDTEQEVLVIIFFV